MRLVDADALKKCAIPCEIHNGALTDLCVPLYSIDSAPTVPLPDFKDGYKQAIIDGKTNFSRSQGEWLNDGRTCSICGETYPRFLGSPNFCAECGADMRGAKNDSRRDA
jgi:hypothetical protein